MRWGFKLWVSCDSSHGYTYNFEVYRGNEGSTLSWNGLSYDVMIDLINGLDHQGYIVYMDNFYTSPILFKEELANLGFGATGTLDNILERCAKTSKGKYVKNILQSWSWCLDKRWCTCLQFLER